MVHLCYETLSSNKKKHIIDTGKRLVLQVILLSETNDQEQNVRHYSIIPCTQESYNDKIIEKENKIVVSKVKVCAVGGGGGYQRVPVGGVDHTVMVHFCTLIVVEVTGKKTAQRNTHNCMCNWQNVNELCGLDQCQFPAHNTVLQLGKVFPLRELTEGVWNLPVDFLATSSESIIISKQSLKN